MVLGGKKRQGFSVDAFGSFCPSLRNRTPEASFFEPRFPLFQENSIHSQSSVQVENLCAFLYKNIKADCFEEGRLISVRQKDSRLFLFANEILGE